MPSSGGSSGPMIGSTQHASHYMVEAQKRRARRVRANMEKPWRDLSDPELQEVLRAASWHTDRLDGKSLTRLVKERQNPDTAAFIDSVLDGKGIDGGGSRER